MDTQVSGFHEIKRLKDNRDAISPFFKFSSDVRKVTYTSNAIEPLSSTNPRLNHQRGTFRSDTGMLKALYLITFEATKRWMTTIRNWAPVYGKLSIMYEGRFPDRINIAVSALQSQFRCPYFFVAHG